MKRKLYSLLSLVLSVALLAAVLPSAFASGTDVVKDHMDWKNWSAAKYFEGTAYYVGELEASNDWNKGYVTRTGGDAKHWISDSNYSDKTNAINFAIYPTRSDTSIPTVVPPSNGGAFGYVGHNYSQFVNATDKTIVPDDKWLGVKDISAYKDNGYLVFKVVQSPVSVDNTYFCITAAADSKSIHPYESTGTTLPISKETHGDVTTDWREHRMTAIRGVKVSDYYDVKLGGSQIVAIPLKKLVDDPDFEEFAGTYYDRLTELYADEDYELDLRLYSGAGIAKRDVEKGERVEMRLLANEGIKIVALETPTNLTASVNANKITLSWTKTGDEGVSYRLARTINGVTEYIDAGAGSSFTDTVTANGTYKYAVEAYSSAYNVPSAPSNSVDAVVAVEGAINADAESLLLEDFVVPTGQSSTTERAKPRPLFLGDFYVTSDGKLDPSRFHSQGYYASHSDYQRWYINDTGYVVTEGDNDANKGRAITYRPKAAGEYYAIKAGNASLTADAYVPHYVGVMADGSTVPEEYVYDNWGYNGYVYANNYVRNNYRDMTDYADTGYILYNINVPEGMSTDGVYLAITTTDPNWIDSKGDHTAEIVVGVPLDKYYDKSVGGYQTIMVPFGDYDFTKKSGDNDVFVHGSYNNKNFVLFTVYDQYRKYNNVHWECFSGIGIVRNDLDDTKCEEFYVDVKNLAVINDIVKTPEIKADFIPASECVALEWTGSGYSDTTYTIIKSDGISDTEINVGEDTIYVDRDIDDGTYTYAVKATVGKYAL